MTSEQVTFSIVIPTHNRHTDLPACLASLSAQTTAPAQIIVVDDGSTPPVASTDMQDAATAHVTVIRHDRPLGPSAARNAGIRTATGDFVAFLDDDDTFDPRKIEILTEAVREHPHSDVLYHPAAIHMIREGVTYTSTPKDLGRVSAPFQDLLIGNWVGGTSMVAVRRSALLDVDGFDEQLTSMEDHDLWIRLALHGAVFHLIPDALTHYRYITRGGSLSTDLDSNFAAAEVLRQKYPEGYASLTPQQQRRHELWLLNVATHRALLAGDARLARQLQRRAVRVSPRPATLASAAVTALGPRAAFRLRAFLSRGPTAAGAAEGQATGAVEGRR